MMLCICQLWFSMFKSEGCDKSLPGRRSALNVGNYVWNLVTISSIQEYVYSAFKCLIEKTFKEGNWVLQCSNIFRSNLTKNAAFHLSIESDEMKIGLCMSNGNENDIVYHVKILNHCQNQDSIHRRICFECCGNWKISSITTSD